MITFIFSWAPDCDMNMLLATWHDFLMSLFTGSAIWLTNKLQKCTEMYGLKMCLRNVRHPSRTRRFWYYIRVLFIVGILLLCALELKICLGVKYPPPAAGKRRQKTAAGTRVNIHW